MTRRSTGPLASASSFRTTTPLTCESARTYFMPMPLAGARTLIDLLETRAGHGSVEPAYTFLVDGERQQETLTYAELARRARRVAAAMAGEPGARALLLFPPGLDFVVAFFGCLYARVIGVPVYPPQRSRDLG